ncbi:MAG: flagellar assembly protein FliX [Pseudobdellovibrionaceae bacterium]
MKITGPDKSRETSKTGKSSKSADTSGAFGALLSGSEGPQGSAQTFQTNSVASIDALLAAQAAEDPAERASRGRMVARADKILDELDKARLAMLTGRMNVGTLLNLADVATAHMEKVSDPRLLQVLAEIDCRAQVEIAKMRVALEKAF